MSEIFITDIKDFFMLNYKKIKEIAEILGRKFYIENMSEEDIKQEVYLHILNPKTFTYLKNKQQFLYQCMYITSKNHILILKNQTLTQKRRPQNGFIFSLNAQYGFNENTLYETISEERTKAHVKYRYTDELKKELGRKASKRWVENNKERRKAYKKQWNKDNKERINKYQLEWSKNNPEKRKANSKKYREKRKDLN